MSFSDLPFLSAVELFLDDFEIANTVIAESKRTSIPQDKRSRFLLREDFDSSILFSTL